MNDNLNAALASVGTFIERVICKRLYFFGQLFFQSAIAKHCKQQKQCASLLGSQYIAKTNFPAGLNFQTHGSFDVERKGAS